MTTSREIELESQVAMLQEQLHRLRASDTEKPPPPNSLPPDAETGDHSKNRECANMLQRIDNLESRESDRAGALQALDMKVDRVIEMLGQMTLIDPKEFRELKAAIEALPCHPGCPNHPHLSVVPDTAE